MSASGQEGGSGAVGGRATIPCEEVMLRLWDYMDGELDHETTARVWEHLRLCECCFPHYDFQRAFRAFLRRHDASPVPAQLRKKVFRMLLEEEAGGAAGQP